MIERDGQRLVIHCDTDRLEQELQKKVSEDEKTVRELNARIFQESKSWRHGGKAQMDDMTWIIVDVL
jgi:hypothetical protein